ncbi:MAG TPA: DUF5615 family PIN-like protein [Planctomycetota bacterium]|nr:DUF5615 family PIN-like protein [Planctomycetota bacterium]
MRFLVNMSVSPKIAAALAEMGHEAIHCVDLGMERARDEEILARAHKEGPVDERSWKNRIVVVEPARVRVSEVPGLP